MTRIIGAPLALAAAMMLASMDMAEARAVTDSGPSPAAAATETSPREDRVDRMIAECRDEGGTHLERGECMMPE